jgi:hypothetical protein
MLNPVSYALIECLAWGRRQFRNPTKGWPPRRVTELIFDVAARSLSEVRIDAPVHAARMFGPADRLTGVSPDYDLLYYALGLEIGQFRGNIASFRLLTEPTTRVSYWERRCMPARLQVQGTDGSRHVLSQETTEASVLRFFGNPLETGPVAGERVHSFRVGGNLFDTHHDQESSRLVELTICAAS